MKTITTKYGVCGCILEGYLLWREGNGGGTAGIKGNVCTEFAGLSVYMVACFLFYGTLTWGRGGRGRREEVSIGRGPRSGEDDVSG